MKYTIKPLEWKDKVHVSAIADTLLGRYVVTENGPKYVVIFFPPTGLITSLNPNPTLEAAKAAAEADWQARIKEALEPVQDWISVKDRLPKTMTHVIAHGAIQSMQYSDLQIVTEAFRVLTGEWVSVLAPGIIMNVTHWQPMPEPPKEEKE